MSGSRLAHTSALSPLRRRLTNGYLGWLCFVLLGYALLGKGFAYLGARPLYVGEVSLIFGLGALLATARSVAYVTRRPVVWLLAITSLWGAVRTVPYLSTFGVSALRDAVIWGYGIFAVIIAALLVEKPTRLKLLIRRYNRFILLFVGLIWLLYVITKAASGLLPQLPGAPVPLVHLKMGDVQVHLGGIAVFLLLGMARAPTWFILLLLVELFVGGMQNRGGFVSAGMAVTVVLLLRPSISKRLPRLAVGAGALLLLFVTVEPMIPTVRSGGRTISVEQLQKNVESIFSETEGGSGLQGTKEWRLNWWGDIIGYTVNGPHFWTGKGFGVNLADSDGYQVTHDRSLRSPHNGHMTMLARTGVPGFVLWVLLHLTWFMQMLRAYFRSMNRNHHSWSNVFLFLIAYWVAFMTNASFDVFLEGPMGGIWFWVLFGVGIGAMQIYRQRPEVLCRRDSAPERPSAVHY